eukprot:TRINITY_DN2974_c0_g1_i1.p1 TRINITY_DN2974_c0_g1~~TRINITY_DN2974_c0_g1_i1.p1  ORF type:complete len:367 (-),score=93.93 TRINITY_DN2974_c0_g1_i1:66-1121(-)
MNEEIFFVALFSAYIICNINLVCCDQLVAGVERDADDLKIDGNMENVDTNDNDIAEVIDDMKISVEIEEEINQEILAAQKKLVKREKYLKKKEMRQTLYEQKTRKEKLAERAGERRKERERKEEEARLLEEHEKQLAATAQKREEYAKRRQEIQEQYENGAERRAAQAALEERVRKRREAIRIQNSMRHEIQNVDRHWDFDEIIENQETEEEFGRWLEERKAFLGEEVEDEIEKIRNQINELKLEKRLLREQKPVVVGGVALSPEELLRLREVIAADVLKEKEAEERKRHEKLLADRQEKKKREERMRQREERMKKSFHVDLPGDTNKPSVFSKIQSKYANHVHDHSKHIL